jgi:hypothetical protein
MSQLITCAQCGKKLNVPEPAAGKTVRCPACGARVQSPAAPTREETRDVEVVELEPVPDEPDEATPRRRPVHSYEEDEYDDRAWPPGRRPAPAPRSYLGLILGLIGAGVALLVGSAVALYFVFRPTEIDPNAWSDFVPPNGRCRISLPGRPVQQAGEQGPGIFNGQSHVLDVRHAGITFTLAFFDVTDEALAQTPWDQRCAAVRDRVVAEHMGRVVKTNEMLAQNHRGLEYLIEGGGGETVVQQFYLEEARPHNRIYLVQVAGKGIQPGSGDAARFLTSFWLPPAVIGDGAGNMGP